MKASISALMDGELEASELRAPLQALEDDADARDAWRIYHVISDALHGGSLLSSDCIRRVSERLAAEPALIGPLPSQVAPAQRPRWFVPSALAASLAAVALVGWMAFAPPQEQLSPAPPVTVAAPQQAASPIQPVSVTAREGARVALPARQPLTAAARDYLIAHQAFSPRTSLQGMAPYVRFVSAEPAPGRKP